MECSHSNAALLSWEEDLQQSWAFFSIYSCSCLMETVTPFHARRNFLQIKIA